MFKEWDTSGKTAYRGPIKIFGVPLSGEMYATNITGDLGASSVLPRRGQALCAGLFWYLYNIHFIVSLFFNRCERIFSEVGQERWTIETFNRSRDPAGQIVFPFPLFCHVCVVLHRTRFLIDCVFSKILAYTFLRCGMIGLQAEVFIRDGGLRYPGFRVKSAVCPSRE